MLQIRHNSFAGHWKTIIEKFNELNIQYTAATDDAAFWHFEMTSASMLSAAAWRAGIPSACEVSSAKTRHNGARGRPAGRFGRLDLLLAVADEDSGDHTYEWVEAKKPPRTLLADCELHKLDLIANEISKARKDSLDVKKEASEWGGYCVSMVFLALRLSPSEYGRGIRPQRRELIADRAVEELKAALIRNGIVSRPGISVDAAASFDTSADAAQDYEGYRAFGYFVIAERCRAQDLPNKW